MTAFSLLFSDLLCAGIPLQLEECVCDGGGVYLGIRRVRSGQAPDRPLSLIFHPFSCPFKENLALRRNGRKRPLIDSRQKKKHTIIRLSHPELQLSV